MAFLLNSIVNVSKNPSCPANPPNSSGENSNENIAGEEKNFPSTPISMCASYVISRYAGDRALVL